MKRLTVAMWLTLCLALPASAQMYKWVDSNGKVQYSDKPPPSNIKTEKLRGAAPAASAPAASTPTADDAKGAAKKDAAKAVPKTQAQEEQAFRKRQLDASKAQETEEKKQAEARQKEENCTRARAALTNLEMGGRQVRIDDKGERVFLEEDQIARETAKARQDVATACK